jgi:hypothetical protein
VSGHRQQSKDMLEAVTEQLSRIAKADPNASTGECLRVAQITATVAAVNALLSLDARLGDLHRTLEAIRGER